MLNQFVEYLARLIQMKDYKNIKIILKELRQLIRHIQLRNKSSFDSILVVPIDSFTCNEMLSILLHRQIDIHIHTLIFIIKSY